MPIIVESRKDFGSMNSGSIRFSNLTEKDKEFLAEKYGITIKDLETFDLTHDKKCIFMRHREDFGHSMGFDGRKMFMADQKDKSGSFFEVTRDYSDANPDGWTDIDEDILVVRKTTPGIVIGHPVADCPVVMMMDRRQGITAIGHCSAELIDLRLPMMISEVLQSAYSAKADDIITYVSACAGDSWTYDKFPKWAKDMDLWEKCVIYGDDGKFHINLRPAIMLQIISSGLKRENVVFNMDDTIFNPNYFSNSASSPYGLNQEEKAGRHFAGAFYDDSNDELKIHKGRR